MDLVNMERLPESARKALTPYLENVIGVFRDNIVAIFAYGSVTGPNYDKKTSDINIAVVLKDASIKELKPVLRSVRAGIKKGITVPVFLTPSYIKMSLDTFPMEFLNMKDTRLMLAGKDVLSDISAEKEDIRRECEYQLKGKLLTIRQAYLEQALSRKGLEALIKKSLRALFPVFRNLLRLRRGGVPPLEKLEIICELGEEFSIEVDPLLEVLNDKKTEGHIGGRPAEDFIDIFLVQLEHLSKMVDNL